MNAARKAIAQEERKNGNCHFRHLKSTLNWEAADLVYLIPLWYRRNLYNQRFLEAEKEAWAPTAETGRGDAQRNKLGSVGSIRILGLLPHPPALGNFRLSFSVEIFSTGRSLVVLFSLHHHFSFFFLSFVLPFPPSSFFLFSSSFLLLISISAVDSHCLVHEDFCFRNFRLPSCNTILTTQGDALCVFVEIKTKFSQVL